MTGAAPALRFSEKAPQYCINTYKENNNPKHTEKSMAAMMDLERLLVENLWERMTQAVSKVPKNR